MKKIYLLLALLLSSNCAFSEDGSVSGYLDLSKLELTKQFQFLIGEWTYATADNKAHGSSTVSPQLDGSVISETVNGQFMESAFIGQALYFYDETTQLWTQTWSDSLGNVMKSTVTMTAYEESELPAMVGEVEYQGQKIKHIWYNITESGYQTDLLLSPDDGVSFQLIRRMPYQKTADK
jgi:hypothetical protein